MTAHYPNDRVEDPPQYQNAYPGGNGCLLAPSDTFTYLHLRFR